MPDSRASDPKAGVQGAATAAAKAVEQPVYEPQDENLLDEREARIAELRKQVQDGTYKVDAEKVSAKIVDDQLPK